MSLCGPSACGSCPLLGLCGDPVDLPPEPGDLDAPDRDPAEPKPDDAGCCGGSCGG